MVLKALHAQAKAIGHEGHMQADGTLGHLREFQWFWNMRNWVQACVNSTANPRNPKLPLNLRPIPQEPWNITAIDYKGRIDPKKWYFHTKMDCIRGTQRSIWSKPQKCQSWRQSWTKPCRQNLEWQVSPIQQPQVDQVGQRLGKQDQKDDPASHACEQHHGTLQPKHEANHLGSIWRRPWPSGGGRQAGCQTCLYHFKDWYQWGAQVLSLCIGPSPIQILSGSPAYIETTPLDLVTKRAPCIHYALSLAVYTLGSMSWWDLYGQK